MRILTVLVLIVSLAAVSAPAQTALGLTITGTPPSATLNSSIDYQLFVATGGATPYNWTLAGGGLPAGLALEAATGRIRGVPSVAGTYFFALKATDSTGSCVNGIVGFAVQSSDGSPLPNFAWGNPANPVRLECD